MLTPTIIEIRNTHPPVTYRPFTDTMLRCVGRNNKIACVKLWREVNRGCPVAWDKNGNPAIPGLRSAKKVVEAAMREWDAQEDYVRTSFSYTCRVNEDYNVYSVLDNEGETEYNTITRKELA